MKELGGGFPRQGKASKTALTGQEGEGMAFILGSGSPRRLQLLAQLGVHPDEVRPPEIDETPLKGELPRDYCARVTREKTRAVPAGTEDVVLCADTTVALGRRILGKPRDAGEAAEFLLALSGRRHRVLTGIAVLAPGGEARGRTVTSQVAFKRLARDEIDWYLASGEWRGKAGGCWASRRTRPRRGATWRSCPAAATGC